MLTEDVLNLKSHLNHDESVFAEGWALHGEGGGGAGIAALEIKALIRHPVIMELNLKYYIRKYLLYIYIGT